MVRHLADCGSVWVDPYLCLVDCLGDAMVNCSGRKKTCCSQIAGVLWQDQVLKRDKVACWPQTGHRFGRRSKLTCPWLRLHLLFSWLDVFAAGTDEAGQTFSHQNHCLWETFINYLIGPLLGLVLRDCDKWTERSAGELGRCPPFAWFWFS